MDDMDAEAKAQRLGQVIAYLQGDLKELQARVTMRKPIKKVEVHKGFIEDATVQIEEREKETKLITKWWS